MGLRFGLALLFLLCSSAGLFAQRNEAKKDSLQAEKDTALAAKKQPKKARKLRPGYVALMSTALPGSGQVYNGQWYKAPIIIGALTGIGFVIDGYEKDFMRYKTAYLIRTDGDPTTLDLFDRNNPKANINTAIADEKTLLDYREEARHNRDLMYIVAVAVFTANVLDAYVYAHLREFDVSPNLSLRAEPAKMTNIAGRYYYTPGITLNFKH